eukprot:TRINITY_DN778253_c0_g1_i1.p1 TRINITY_DN778253_c0_g1~~TRINITY_DN778253_c0_g1_i1.p1  ORF type:complete len:140 (-),score=23.39 TRINITY_DN778253_c0_g1_i1:205-624(-)
MSWKPKNTKSDDWRIRLVSGAVLGATVGYAFGVVESWPHVMNQYKVRSISQMIKPNIGLTLTKQATKFGLCFCGAMAFFSAGECIARKVRGKKDFVNFAIGSTALLPIMFSPMKRSAPFVGFLFLMDYYKDVNLMEKLK